MYMAELWETIDKTICSFTKQRLHCSILWKKNVLYSKFRGEETGKVLCGSKTIISVPGQSEANSLVKMLRSVLKEPRLLVKDTKTKKERPYRLKIKVIACTSSIDMSLEQKRLCGKMLLKKSKIAITKHNLSLNQIHNLIDGIFQKKLDALDHEQNVVSQRLCYQKNPALQRSILDCVKQEKREIIDRQEKLRHKLNVILQCDQKYCVSGYKPYARNYRITYNDITACRKQVAVGDVLIVIGGSQVLLDPRITKERSDTFVKKHESIFCLGTSYDYYIYEEDKVTK